MDRVITLSKPKFFEENMFVLDTLKKYGLEVHSPEFEKLIEKPFEDRPLDEKLKILQKVQGQISFSNLVYLVNPDNCLEGLQRSAIDYAYFLRKPIYFSNQPKDNVSRSLYSDVVPLDKLCEFLDDLAD